MAKMETKQVKKVPTDQHHVALPARENNPRQVEWQN